MLELNKIYNMDCLEGLKQLPDNSINCCVTSPPYWGLRDYGVEGQLGLEKTPEAYVERMVEVFREVRRVLRDDGTLWLNLGDSYTKNKSNNGGYSEKSTLSGFTRSDTKGRQANESGLRIKLSHGLKKKDLIGIPWRVAFALQADGWYLRQDIIWHKPNVMPESVKDRPTKAHEYIFLLSKSSKYYYDAEAIKEPLARPEALLQKTPAVFGGRNKHDGYGTRKYSGNKYVGTYTGRNKRSVWTVTTKPFKEAHFAVFPPALIEPCILAGCPEGGIVLDPFIGSGTTALVAKRLNRNYIGIDINPEYCKMSEERLKGLTYKDKQLIQQGQLTLELKI